MVSWRWSNYIEILASKNFCYPLHLLISFLLRCYVLFGEIVDLLALINAAIGFVLYGSMSKQFRVTFKSLFLRQHPQSNKTEVTRVTAINNTTTTVWLRIFNCFGIERWNIVQGKGLRSSFKTQMTKLFNRCIL